VDSNRFHRSTRLLYANESNAYRVGHRISIDEAPARRDTKDPFGE